MAKARVTVASVSDLRARAFDSMRSMLSEDTKRAIISRRHRLRRPTARWRMLPGLVTIGAMRGGTTSLYNYLAMHPQVKRPLHKEIEYFTTHYADGSADWYRAHFALDHRSAAITTESSPSYLFDPRAAARARQVLPDARFVVLLRNPADRAFSHYQLMVTKGVEPLSYAAALASEEERVAGEWEKMAADPYYVSVPHRQFSYAGHGMYARQLEGWFAQFPPDRFLILRSEDFYADPRACYLEVLRFAGLDEWLPAAFRTYAYRINSRTRALRPGDATRDALLARFEQPNRDLARLVGRDFTWS